MRMISSPRAAFNSERAIWTIPEGSQAAEPAASFVPGAGTPKRTRAGTPRETSFLASTRREPTVCWDWPGRDPMGCGSEIPSRTKKGAIRSRTGGFRGFSVVRPIRCRVTLRGGPGIRRRSVMGSPDFLSAGRPETFSGFLTNFWIFLPGTDCTSASG